MSRKNHPQSRGMNKKSKRKKTRASKNVKVFVMQETLEPQGAQMSAINGAGDAAGDEPRGMKWVNSKKNTSGRFFALDKDVLHDVPERLSATPAARIEMYHSIVAAIEADAVRRREENIADTGKVEVAIPWTMLDFPKDGVGRAKQVDAGHVGHIVQNYDKGSYQVPVVVMRPVFDEDGELVTVYFEVTDGMHRTRITLERAYATHPEDLRTGINPVKIRVGVNEVALTQDTANSFTNNNCRQKKVMRSDDWRNMYLAKIPAVVDTVELAAEYGIDVSEPPNTRGWPRAHGRPIQIMRNVTDENIPGHFPWIKEEDVRNALRFITDPACTTVYRNSDAIDKGTFFCGLCHFLAFYYRTGYVHDIGVQRLLSLPNLISNCLDAYDKLSVPVIKIEMPFVTDQMVGGNPERPRAENKRYLGVATALKQFYVHQVPPPKSRSANDGWVGCPAELRQLFHIAPKIEDETERRHFIAELHAKIASKEQRKQTRTKSLVR